MVDEGARPGLGFAGVGLEDKRRPTRSIQRLDRIRIGLLACQDRAASGCYHRLAYLIAMADDEASEVANRLRSEPSTNGSSAAIQ